MKSNKKFTANLQLACVGLILTFVCAAGAQTPLANLMKQPSDARHFVIQSTGGKHGDSWMWIDASGHHLGRESMNLRGQVFEVDSEGKMELTECR